MLVREARPSEYEAIGALTVAAYEALLGGAGLGEYREELEDVATRAGAGTVLVAVEADEVLGAVTFVPGPGSAISEFEDREASGIRMLAVTPERQRAGAGRALTEACVARARQLGRRRVVLHSTRPMTVARGMYERLGFVRDPAHDVVIEEAGTPDEPFVLLAYALEL